MSSCSFGLPQFPYSNQRTPEAAENTPAVWHVPSTICLLLLFYWLTVALETPLYQRNMSNVQVKSLKHFLFKCPVFIKVEILNDGPLGGHSIKACCFCVRYAGWQRPLKEYAALLFIECIRSGSPNTGWTRRRSLPGWILSEHVARYKCVRSHSSLLVWYLSQCGPLRWNYCHSWQDDSLQVIKEVMIQKRLADSWATDRFCSHPYLSNCGQHLFGL